MNGFNNFEKKLKEIAEAKKRALFAVGMFVHGEAFVRTPILTGNLVNSLRVQLQGDDAVRVGTNTDYAAHVEYGTSKQKAQPYLRPAVDDNIERIDKLFKEIIGEKL